VPWCSRAFSVIPVIPALQIPKIEPAYKYFNKDHFILVFPNSLVKHLIFDPEKVSIFRV
jgi:hypothetical protein